MATVFLFMGLMLGLVIPINLIRFKRRKRNEEQE